jgi:hypothetical protein
MFENRALRRNGQLGLLVGRIGRQHGCTGDFL